VKTKCVYKYFAGKDWGWGIRASYSDKSWILNTSQKSLNRWRKVPHKVWFVVFREYLGAAMCWLRRSELESLNRCVYWTTRFVLTKFTGYVLWLLADITHNFDSILYYMLTIYRSFFPGDCFIGAPCSTASLNDDHAMTLRWPGVVFTW